MLGFYPELEEAKIHNTPEVLFGLGKMLDITDKGKIKILIKKKFFRPNIQIFALRLSSLYLANQSLDMCTGYYI